MHKYFKKHYSVIIIGSALAGMASALELSKKGINDILILEQHNLPGGLATSFVRDGVELEATLHEMMSIGNENQLSIGKFLKEQNISVSWVRVPDAFRYVDKEINVLVHGGMNGEIDKTVEEISSVSKDPSSYKKTHDFLSMCMKIYKGMNDISENKMGVIKILAKYPEVARICGYSVQEVYDAFKLPIEVQKVLSAYWIYIGNRIDDMPAMIYCYMIADYLGYGSYVPEKCSHELSIKMAEECLKRSIQIEYKTKVDKILVEKNKVKGVKLQNGETIFSSYVISGCYPNTVYNHMIEPKEEAPKKCFSFLNSKKLSLSCFSVILILDVPPERLNIHDYSTFYAPEGLDFDKILDSFKGVGPYKYITSICPSVIPSLRKENQTIYSITALPFSDGWLDVNEENYDEFKKKNAKYFIDIESERLGVNLYSHIKEIVIETPVSVSHYTNAFRGLVYGYQHNMRDVIVARMNVDDKIFHIHGLTFAGAHQTSGDGMSPAIASGRKACKDILSFMKRDQRRRKHEN